MGQVRTHQTQKTLARQLLKLRLGRTVVFDQPAALSGTWDNG